jgi:hypothetical protein
MSRNPTREMRVDHSLVGKQVEYQGHIWRVSSARRRNDQGKAWLILRRHPRVIVMVKEYEVRQVFD